MLSDYADRLVVEFLQYGWPIDRDPDIPLEMGGRNHRGAVDFPDHIDAYVKKEIQLGAQVGPFEAIPFAGNTITAISPLSTRPKKDSDKRRIIMDCSWPIGCSLNDGLCKFMYLGERIMLKYPTVDDLARRTYELRVSDAVTPILFYKEDLERAFRQLFACPGSVPLLGFRWRTKYYFDLVMAMGCTIAPYICQRTTNMIVYLHEQMGYFLLNYVDDFIGVEFQSRAIKAHSAHQFVRSDRSRQI